MATITTQPTTVPVAKAVDFKDFPLWVICPKCGATIQTEVKHQVGCGTWCAFASMVPSVIFTLCSPFVFCHDKTRDAVHTCPNCQEEVGKKTLIDC